MPPLQHFPVRGVAGAARLGLRFEGEVCWMGEVASDILSGLFEASGVLAEEFHEAYLPAESPQEGKDARFSQAHEHGRWAQDGRRPAPAWA